MATYEVYRGENGIWYQLPEDYYVASEGTWRSMAFELPDMSSASDATSLSLVESSALVTTDSLVIKAANDAAVPALVEVSGPAQVSNFIEISSSDELSAQLSESNSISTGGEISKGGGDAASVSIGEVAAAEVITQSKSAQESINLTLTDTGAVDDGQGDTINTYGAEGYLGGYAA